jgi:hypothetical protein
MKKIMLWVFVSGLYSSISMASSLYCDQSEFSYENLSFKKSSNSASGFIVLVETTSGPKWVNAYEHFIERGNGFRLKGIINTNKTYEACGELNSDGLSISKIAAE